ncbi:MAG: hypothetical protein Roseis2KO_41420 [Roseivirga sp.]
MTNIEKKLQQLASQNPTSDWKQKVEHRRANKAWLDKSFETALRILDALEERGWTQSRLADEMGVSRQQVAKIVKGKVNFTYESICKLEKALGIQLVTILQSDEEVIKKETRAFYQKNVLKYGISVKPVRKVTTGSTYKSEKVILQIAS